MAYLLSHLLLETAQRFPDRTAVRCRGRSLDYARLDELSSRLAGLLAARGVRRGDRVGLLLPKSLEQIISVFGVLKSGACYVPLDPFWPAARSSYVISDCGIRALLSTPRLFQRLAGSTPPSLVPIAVPLAADADLNWEEVQASPPRVCQTGIEDDLAYILYTSGSTGRPKGVAIRHRASLTFVEWAGDCFEIREEDRLSNHAPLHFDLSVFDIFSGIRAGASTVQVPEEYSSFPRNLLKFLEEESISVWYSVPSVLIRMLDAGLSETHPETLRTVLFAGEVFPAKHLARLRRALPKSRLFNLFGPTETNVCTYHEVKEVPDPGAVGSNIGKACSNTEVWVETEEGEPAASGQAGELIVRGACLMSGYWNQPEETAKVMRREWVAGMEKCSYRTGDWVRQDSEGDLIFLGRRDHLIKLRGYRIELGEIEEVLHSCELVREAAVVAHLADGAHEPEIIAFAVASASNPESAAVVGFCDQQLPRYMIPSRVVFVASLPRTSTGKIDRQSLLQHPLLKGDAAS